MPSTEIVVLALTAISSLSLTVNGFFLAQMFGRLSAVELKANAHDVRLAVLEHEAQQ